MPLRQTTETLAHTTVPIPVGISGLTWLGITMKDWVLMSTLILLVFQLVVISPKAYQVIRSGIKHTKLFLKETIKRG